MGRASQIDIEKVREAAAFLGLGPDLSAAVATLQAQVAALQAADTALQAADVALQAADTALQADVDVHSDFIGDALFKVAAAWVCFDAGGILAGIGVGNVAANGGPGLWRITFAEDLLDPSYAAVFGAAGGTVEEVARTTTTLDLDAGAATLVSVAVFSATVIPE